MLFRRQLRSPWRTVWARCCILKSEWREKRTENWFWCASHNAFSAHLAGERHRHTVKLHLAAAYGVFGVPPLLCLSDLIFSQMSLCMLWAMSPQIVWVYSPFLFARTLLFAPTRSWSLALFIFGEVSILRGRGKKTISEDLCKEVTLCKNIFTSPTYTFLSV